MLGLKRILLIDSSYPINTRNSKIVQSLSEHFYDFDVSIIAWNRDNRAFKYQENEYVFQKQAKYGNPFKKMIALFSYYKYYRKKINQLKPNIIIASHWDMLLLSYSIKKKNQLLIYENLDIPTFSNKYVLKGLQSIEKILLKKVDIIIHASRFFRDLYKSFDCDQIVLENKPIFSKTLRESSNSEKLKISFIGSVRYYEILRNLVDSVKNLDEIDLYIHGEGEDYSRIKAYSKKFKNIFITGRYEYKDIDKMYLNSDVIWAVYPSEDFNVKYAISNKFHESLFFEIPCIYAKGTKLGDLVYKENLGFIVDPYDINDIKNCFVTLLKERKSLNKIVESIKKFSNDETTWEKDFQELVKIINIRFNNI